MSNDGKTVGTILGEKKGSIKNAPMPRGFPGWDHVTGMLWSDPTYNRLLSFLSTLDDRKIAYSLNHVRDDAVMVEIAVPGERWEVEFLFDGSVDVERFISTGALCGEEALGELLAHHSDS
jgi:hypothetical protein